MKEEIVYSTDYPTFKIFLTRLEIVILNFNTSYKVIDFRAFDKATKENSNELIQISNIRFAEKQPNFFDIRDLYAELRKKEDEKKIVAEKGKEQLFYELQREMKALIDILESITTKRTEMLSLIREYNKIHMN